MPSAVSRLRASGKEKRAFLSLFVLKRDGVILRLAEIRAGEVVVGKKSSLEIGAGKPALGQIAFIENEPPRSQKLKSMRLSRW